MPRNVLDPRKPDRAEVVPFPPPMAKAVGTVEGVHVEVHLGSHAGRPAEVLHELAQLAASSPLPGAADADVLLRIAVAADLLIGNLVSEGVGCVAIAIGTSLTTGAHAGSAEFHVAESRVTSAVVIDQDGNRSALSTVWERVDDHARTAVTVRSTSAAGCLALARQARERPAVASVLFSSADADGWFVYPDGRIESCA